MNVKDKCLSIWGDTGELLPLRLLQLLRTALEPVCISVTKPDL